MRFLPVATMTSREWGSTIMRQPRSSDPRWRWLAAIAIGLVLAACEPIAIVTPTSTASPSPSRPSPTPTPTALASPLGFDVRDLPRREFDHLTATAVCDPSPDQLPDDAITVPIDPIWCEDGLSIALRALALVGDPSVARLYLHRPFCFPSALVGRQAVVCDGSMERPERVRPSSPEIEWPSESCPITDPTCLAQYGSTVLVSATTTDGGAWLIAIRRAKGTIIGTIEPADPIWPTSAPMFPSPVYVVPDGSASPAGDGLDGLPTCGSMTWGEPHEVAGCFRNAVIDGTPVRVTETTSGVEGGEIVTAYAFSGSGPVRAVVLVTPDRSLPSRSMGALILNFEPWSWSYTPLAFAP